MKRVGTKNMKIIAATAMTIFSLFAATVGVFAWFAGKCQEVERTDDFDVTVTNGRLKNIYFHRYETKNIDDNTLKPTSFTFESSYCGIISYDWVSNTASYDGDPIVNLRDYTPLDSAHPLLIVFELNDAYEIDSDGEMYINATTSVNGFLGARDENNAPAFDLKTNGVYETRPDPEDSTKTKYYYALSSVVNFYCNDTGSELYNKNNGVNTTLINTTYYLSNLQNREDSIAAKQQNPNANVPDLSFTSINNSNDQTSFNQSPCIYTSSANTTVRYISIIVDYYSDALDYIYSTYLGNDTLETEFDSHLDFLCDWGLEIV